MIVMNTDGDIFDERRRFQRRKNLEGRRQGEKEMMIDRREEESNDRRSGLDRRVKDINEKCE